MTWLSIPFPDVAVLTPTYLVASGHYSQTRPKPLAIFADYGTEVQAKTQGSCFQLKIPVPRPQPQGRLVGCLKIPRQKCLDEVFG
jgi:hypothetical protein